PTSAAAASPSDTAHIDAIAIGFGKTATTLVNPSNIHVAPTQRCVVVSRSTSRSMKPMIRSIEMRAEFHLRRDSSTSNATTDALTRTTRSCTRVSIVAYAMGNAEDAR